MMKTTRREFIRGAALATLGLILGRGQEKPIFADVPSAELPSEPTMYTHHITFAEEKEVWKYIESLYPPLVRFTINGREYGLPISELDLESS